MIGQGPLLGGGLWPGPPRTNQEVVWFFLRTAGPTPQPISYGWVFLTRGVLETFAPAHGGEAQLVLWQMPGRVGLNSNRKLNTSINAGLSEHPQHELAKAEQKSLWCGSSVCMGKLAGRVP